MWDFKIKSLYACAGQNTLNTTSGQENAPTALYSQKFKIKNLNYINDIYGK